MADPVLKLETEYLRIAVSNFYIGFTPEVEAELTELDLDLADLQNALVGCVVNRSNKTDAEGAHFVVFGRTTEGDQLEMSVWVNPDTRFLRVEAVSKVLGARR